MSRSYKKRPIVKDKNKGTKQQANKKVRKFKYTIQNGKSYKKIFNSYDISDFSFECTLKHFLNKTYNKNKSYFDWYKNYKMK